MPHIIAEGCHINKQIRRIKIHAEIEFSNETWKNVPKVDRWQEEVREKIESLLMEYFEMSEITSENYSNHEYNTRMSNY